MYGPEFDSIDLESVANQIVAIACTSVAPAPESRISGGCINLCFRWMSEQGPLFIKVAPVVRQDMLRAEAAGLAELRAARAVRVPTVVGVGADQRHAVLVLEWMELQRPSARSEAEFGRMLARQHRVAAPQFGWHRDNTLGATAQVNTPSPDWCEFFHHRRLSVQLALAARNGYTGRLQTRGIQLLATLGRFFATHSPTPSLLHGDLWGGNWAADAAGAPVIFDPAVYYGDRETDLAMTRLFGGFGPAFYRAYEAEWPLDRDAPARVELYNLYHVLNHVNLFGHGYLSQAQSMIERLLHERAG